MSATTSAQVCASNGSSFAGSTGAPALDIEGLAGFLRRRERLDTAWRVSRAAGISEHTVRNWLGLRARPSGPNLTRLVEAYGPGVLAACFPPGGVPRDLEIACHAARDAEIARQIAALEAERAAIARHLPTDTDTTDTDQGTPDGGPPTRRPDAVSSRRRASAR